MKTKANATHDRGSPSQSVLALSSKTKISDVNGLEDSSNSILTDYSVITMSDDGGSKNPLNSASETSLLISSCDDNQFESPFCAYTNVDVKSRCKPVGEWTPDDLHKFLLDNKLEKFAEILPKDLEADGRDLYNLYLMSCCTDSTLFDHIKKENPEIRLFDYTRFLKTLEPYCKSA